MIVTIVPQVYIEWNDETARSDGVQCDKKKSVRGGRRRSCRECRIDVVFAASSENNKINMTLDNLSHDPSGDKNLFCLEKKWGNFITQPASSRPSGMGNATSSIQ